MAAAERQAAASWDDEDMSNGLGSSEGRIFPFRPTSSPKKKKKVKQKQKVNLNRAPKSPGILELINPLPGGSICLRAI